MRVAGIVKWFNDYRGFGFIKPADGRKDFRRDRIVPQSQIKRPEQYDYHGGHEAPEGYAQPQEPVGATKA